MPQSKHLYRVNVYLGKENYNQIKALADLMGMSVAQMTRVIIDTGMQISKSLEKGVFGNGSK